MAPDRFSFAGQVLRRGSTDGTFHTVERRRAGSLADRCEGALQRAGTRSVRVPVCPHAVRTMPTPHVNIPNGPNPKSVPNAHPPLTLKPTDLFPPEDYEKIFGCEMGSTIGGLVRNTWDRLFRFDLISGVTRVWD
jgi:hypothetical protein